MGKRQQRFYGEDIQKQLPELLNLELNVVLKNGRSVHGKIINFDQNFFSIKDMFNKKHQISVKEILEIITDKTTAY